MAVCRRSPEVEAAAGGAGRGRLLILVCLRLHSLFRVGSTPAFVSRIRRALQTEWAGRIVRVVRRTRISSAAQLQSREQPRPTQRQRGGAAAAADEEDETSSMGRAADAPAETGRACAKRRFAVRARRSASSAAAAAAAAAALHAACLAATSRRSRLRRFPPTSVDCTRAEIRQRRRSDRGGYGCCAGGT